MSTRVKPEEYKADPSPPCGAKESMKLNFSYTFLACFLEIMIIMLFNINEKINFLSVSCFLLGT
jgi:hypothetical protein